MSVARNSAVALVALGALASAVLPGCRPAAQPHALPAAAPTAGPTVAGDGRSVSQRTDSQRTDSPPPDRAEAPVGPLERPSPRPSGYVGSQACAGCHAAINESFSRHPMGQAMDDMPPGRPIEASAPPVFHDREREYVVEERDGTILHHERVFAPDGSIIYDQAVPVRFAVGSGTRGRSYLIDRDGLLFQSPIGWYTGTGHYGISPGYELDRSLRFERSIGDGCLHCHAGLVDHEGERLDRYSGQVFAEASIGCERCHGPGADHVAAMSALPAGEKATDLRIVNPADLDPSRREAVCNQCHLGGEATIPRFGRGFYDFRPGDHLDDTLLVFVHDERARAASGEKPVSQVEQMRQSACWTGTEGRIGCISCHDPHQKPAPAEMDAFYRRKCNACHADKPCSAPLEEQQAPPADGSCIRCHMPSQSLREIAHTAMTDHRVPRRPEEAGHSAKGSAPLVAFDDAASRVPPRELERARGLALASLPGATRSTRGAQEAIRAIVPRGIDPGDRPAILAALAGDAEALRGLGQLFASSGRIDGAIACWEGVLEADPHDGETLTLLALQMQRSGRVRDALGMLDRLVADNPWIAAVHSQRATLLATLGRIEEAIDAARQSLELDPTRTPTRTLLIDLLERGGRAAEAEEERATQSRLRGAIAVPSHPAQPR